jgi:hypothetical protein
VHFYFVSAATHICIKLLNKEAMFYFRIFILFCNIPSTISQLFNFLFLLSIFCICIYVNMLEITFCAYDEDNI